MAGLLDRIAGWFGERKTGALARLIPEFALRPSSRSGYAVNALSSLEVTTVLACVRVNAYGLAQNPIRFYARQAGGRVTRDYEHPLADVIAWRPNAWQTAFEFWVTVIFHLMLVGNAFVFVNRVGTARTVRELIPLDPAKVRVERRPDYSLVYTVTGEDGSQRAMPAEAIWHVRGPSWNGWMGLEAVKLAREAIGLAVATEAAHAGLHKNGVQTSGIYTLPDKLSAPDYKTLRDWIVSHTTGDNSGSPLILDRGASFNPVSMTGVDAQHLETRKFQIEEICRAFGVNPIMVGYSDKTATYASAEQMFISHVVHTLAPLARCIENSIEVNLLAETDNTDVKFHLAGLMRGDAKARSEYYAKALGSGGAPAWMTVNEVREDCDLDRLDDPAADELPKPTNVGGAAPAQDGNPDNAAP